MAKDKEDSPLIKQYFEVKAKYPDTVLLFRVGDFYETYGKDALVAVEILQLALTFKSNGAMGRIEMAGFPYHALDNFLPKLVRAGKRVAICDQLEDPKKAKKLVKRGVTELVTPGVSVSDAVLTQSENNFLAGLHIEKDKAGVAFLDISTGEFLTAEGSLDYVDKLLLSFQPKELLYERSLRSFVKDRFHYTGSRFELDEWVYTQDAAENRLLHHFQTKNLKGFGLQDKPLSVIASASLLYYMDMTEHRQLSHIQTLGRIQEDYFVRLDRYTIRSLELCDALNQGGRSLFSVLDRTHTSMGSRLLRRWILFPIVDLKEITHRQNVVESLCLQDGLMEDLAAPLSAIADLERMASKLSVGRLSPRDMVYLKDSLLAVGRIKEILETRFSLDERYYADFQSISAKLSACREATQRIQDTLVDNPPIAANRGETIRPGVNEELDRLRQMSANGKDYLLHIQEREIAATGINSLKISYNSVFGYYIEVRNMYKDKVPQEWIRKQTLVNAERYITPELKEYEEQIVGAEERITEIETRLYGELMAYLLAFCPQVQTNANAVARIDCLMSFARVSKENRYCRPVVDASDVIDIKEGRHPVIELQLPAGEPYIANDVYLDKEKEQILVITGPNMAGKSAYIRQTALIVLMAQTGCFVPAKEAHIGFVDRIFTRVGASDNISLGESTFMVEMTEASDILNNLSPRSLVLFDELGRGTSTYDGISIAWAIVEYIHAHPKCRALTLFATHYHELNEMERSFPRIRNYHISVKETGQKVIFLRKLVRGGSEHSFGIHVAQMAGMPQRIVARSREILEQLEKDPADLSVTVPAKDSALAPGLGSGKAAKVSAKPMKALGEEREGYQLSIFQLDDPVLLDIRNRINGLDINNLTPMEALNILHSIQKILKG